MQSPAYEQIDLAKGNVFLLHFGRKKRFKGLKNKVFKTMARFCKVWSSQGCVILSNLYGCHLTSSIHLQPSPWWYIDGPFNNSNVYAASHDGTSNNGTFNNSTSKDGTPDDSAQNLRWCLWHGASEPKTMPLMMTWCICKKLEFK